MKNVKNIVTKLTLAATIAFSASLSAAPVFKVTKGNDAVYIGGTFHILTAADYPLPAAYNKAYNAADELYFETDMDTLKSPAFAPKMMSVVAHSDGKTLRDDLDEKTYNRLMKYLKSQSLPEHAFNPLNPTGVMLTLTMMEYQKRGFVAQGVDDHFFKLGQKDSKSIDWFETPEEQLAIIDAFDGDDPNGLINYTLDEMGNVDKMIKDLHKSWRTGNMPMLEKVGLKPFSDYPEIYDVMLTSRNNNWMKIITKMFGDKGTEFVLVGALHLPGKDGVLTQLKAQGYKVEQVK